MLVMSVGRARTAQTIELGPDIEAALEDVAVGVERGVVGDER